MRNALLLLAASVLLATGCSRDESSLKHDEKDYQVVQEGSASGVTSTLNAPGEIAAPPLTGTNADTTTAFTLPTGAPSASPAQPGTIASTLPRTATDGTLLYPRDPAPRAAPPARITPTDSAPAAAIAAVQPSDPPASSSVANTTSAEREASGAGLGIVAREAPGTDDMKEPAGDETGRDSSTSTQPPATNT